MASSLPVNVHSSLVLPIVTELCNHHHYRIPEHSHHPKTNHLLVTCCPFSSPSPQPPPVCFLSVGLLLGTVPRSVFKALHSRACVPTPFLGLNDTLLGVSPHSAYPFVSGGHWLVSTFGHRDSCCCGHSCKLCGRRFSASVPFSRGAAQRLHVGGGENTQGLVCVPRSGPE